MARHTWPSAVLILAVVAPLRADDEGLFVTVPTPITSAVVGRIKERVDRAARDHGIRKLVLDFNPDNKEAATPDFGPCYDLAKYLRQKHDVLTVAFVHNKVTRHSVLPVLACKELVMSSDAALGEVVGDNAASLDDADRAIYDHMARPDQVALVRKMYDRSVEVLEGRKNGALFFVDRAREADAARDGVVIVNRRPVLPAGAVGLFRAADAQKFGLCKVIRDSRQQVAQEYQLAPASLREDPLAGRTPEPWRIDVRGDLTPGLADAVRRRVDRAVRRGANQIFLQLECAGGSSEAARDLADFLRNLRDTTPDARPVQTIAFVPRTAPDTAMFIALGCSELVVTADATLGDFGPFLTPPADKRARGRAAVNADAVRDSLAALAEAQGYSGLLIRGMFDPALEIYRARTAKGAIEQRFLTREELDEKGPDGQPKWVQEDLVKPAGKLLKLNGTRAKEFKLARYTVEQPELRDVYRLYGLDAGQIRDAGPDWLDGLAGFIASPGVSLFLVVLGFMCLILEVKMPGVSLPGVIAAVCFVLFFWAHSQMNGQIALLAALLLLLGVAMLAVEIFVIPGFGVVGISGIILMLVGLGLASAERMPQTGSEWGSLGGKVTTFAGGLIVATIGAFIAARHLPHIPYANKLVLRPPSEIDEESAEADPSRSEAAALLGAIGTAATVLRPAGMARFGDRYLDVVTEGAFVPTGARVKVIEIEGNKIVVQEV